MGSHCRPKGHVYRNTLLSTAAGGILITATPIASAQLADGPGAAPGTAQDFVAVAQLSPSLERSSEASETTSTAAGSGSGRHRGHHGHKTAHHHKVNKHRKTAPVVTAAPISAAAIHGSPQFIAQQMIANPQQFSCFSNIIQRESGWDPRAGNSSGAYGIPQALPGSKMRSAGADWRTNPQTQIRWAISYMHSNYGSPCGAWSFWKSHHWY